MQQLYNCQLVGEVENKGLGSIALERGVNIPRTDILKNDRKEKARNGACEIETKHQLTEPHLCYGSMSRFVVYS